MKGVLWLLAGWLLARPGGAISTVRCVLKNNAIETRMREEYAFEIQVNEHWGPHGAERFMQLVEDKFFDGTALFRAVPQYIVQFGIPEDPNRVNPWYRPIPDDEDLRVPFERGVISYVGSRPHSRNYMLFITFTDLNDILGYHKWERPFGKVVKGMDELEANIYTKYGEAPPIGKGPDIDVIHQRGYGYLRANFRKLTYIKRCTVVETNKPPPLTLQLKDQIKREMRAIHEKISLFFTAGDFKSISLLYTHDSQIIPPDGQAIVGRTAIARFYADEHFIMGVTRHDLKVIYSAGRIGNRYFSRNVYTYALKSGDKGEGRETCIYERSKIYVQIFGEHSIMPQMSNISFPKTEL